MPRLWVVARDRGVQVEVGAAEASTTWRPRCTPTSTCSVSVSIARLTTCLAERRRNARRRLSDAEIVTLCVAQVLMGIPSDRRFLRAARRQLGHLFPQLPSQEALHKRRARLAETIEWLVAVFAAQSPGSSDDLLLLDSTPVECGRSLETTRRSQLAEACGYGYSRSHSRWFWGMRLHLLSAPDGTPRAATLTAADRPEREVALPLL